MRQYNTCEMLLWCMGFVVWAVLNLRGNAQWYQHSTKPTSLCSSLLENEADLTRRRQRWRKRLSSRKPVQAIPLTQQKRRGSDWTVDIARMVEGDARTRTCRKCPVKG
ncbi:hypothetical protein F5Y07DRAFT_70597 [Xylaria sp. FL0933]|nr:hypothetical protein F5Y07DRAFT_70597 [Xylaria sp. FL0933]